MMKLYKLFILSASVFLLTALSGCSKEEDVFTTLPEGGLPLTLKVTSDNYISTGTVETRMVEEGYTTQFTSGDEIGVLQLTPSSGNGGETVAKNYRFTLDDEGNWTGVPLSHKQGDEYIVYYPYISVSSKEELEAYCTSFEPRLNQATYEDYTKSDLMKGEGLVSGTTLNVNLEHQMALIVIEVPLGKCATTKDGKVKYHPATTVLGAPAFSWEEGKVPYQTSDERILRYIIKPDADFSLKGSYPYYIGTRKFDIAVTASDAAAKHYLFYTLDEGVEPPGSRDVQVGDYYMSDGTILPGDVASVPEGCIGIVFQADTERMSADELAQGWTHGCVMALTNAGKDSKWGKAATEGDGENSPFAEHASTYKGMYQEIGGYVKTKYMVDTYANEATFQEVNGAFYQASHYGETAATTSYKAPKGTSGWYLPSIGQWWDIFENLGEAKGLATLKDNETTSSNIAISLSGESVFENLNTCLKAASSSVDEFESSKNYWSSSEHNRNNKGLVYAHSVSLTATSLTTTGATKTSNSNRRVRCVLSF